MVFATQRLSNTRYITKRDVSICNDSNNRFPATTNRDRIVAIPRQRLGEQLLSLQRMLTEAIPVTTT
jgi:hypothetical protein